MTVAEFNKYVEAYNNGVINGLKIVYVNGVEYHIGFLHYWIQAMYNEIME